MLRLSSLVARGAAIQHVRIPCRMQAAHRSRRYAHDNAPNSTKAAGEEDTGVKSEKGPVYDSIMEDVRKLLLSHGIGALKTETTPSNQSPEAEATKLFENPVANGEPSKKKKKPAKPQQQVKSQPSQPKSAQSKKDAASKDTSKPPPSNKTKKSDGKKSSAPKKVSSEVVLEKTLDALKAIFPREFGTEDKAATKATSEGDKGSGQKSTSKPANPKGSRESKKAHAEARKKGSTQKNTEVAVRRTLSGDSKQPQLGFYRRRLTTGTTVQSITPQQLELTPIDPEKHLAVPQLQYGLDRVLFNPGVYQLQDPRSRVYNFDPYLGKIFTPVSEFDYDALPDYVTSSKDTTLLGLARQHQKKFTGSTSSMTSLLSHFHFLLSHCRPPNFEQLSKGFEVEVANFTRVTRMPAATFMRWKDGVYAIDADKEFDNDTILSKLGHSMEKLLTVPREEFEKYHKSNSDQISEEDRKKPESYHYTTMGDFMMRSQLDAHNPLVPGTGMFDLKTRAVVSIRHDKEGRDIKNLGKNNSASINYEIRHLRGKWESYEREYYDMIRSVFLKYSLQARMGRMDGIFVSYHNTKRIFGFQYIPLPELDLALHGSEDTSLGDHEFKLSVHLLNEVMTRAAEKFPNKSLRFHVETRDAVMPFMYIFARPVTDDFIHKVQGDAASKAKAAETELMGKISEVVEDGAQIAPDTKDRQQSEDLEADSSEKAAHDPSLEEAAQEGEQLEEKEEEEDQETSLDVWEDMMERVEQILESEEHGLTAVRDSIEIALEQSGLLKDKTPEEIQRYLDALVETMTDGLSVPEEEANEVTDGDEVAVEEEETSSIAEGEELAAPTQEETDSTSPVNTVEDGSGRTEEERQVLSEESPEPEGVESSPSTTAVKAGTENAVEEKQALSEEPATVDSDVSDSPVPEEKAEVVSEESIPSESELETSEDTDGQPGVSPEETSGDASEDNSDKDGSWVDASEGSDEKPTLKDLVLKLTGLSQNISAQAADLTEREQGGQGSVEDQAKLQQFVDILTEIVYKNREATELETTELGATEVETPRSSEEDAAKAESAKTSDMSGKVPEDSKSKDAGHGELLGMVLTIRNKVNGKYVVRPENLNKKDSWVVEYAIEEMTGEAAQTHYAMLLARRKQVFTDMDRKRPSQGGQGEGFAKQLKDLSKKGRKYREDEDAREKSDLIYVFGQKDPVTWEAVSSQSVAEAKTVAEAEEEAEKEGEEAEAAEEAVAEAEEIETKTGKP